MAKQNHAQFAFNAGELSPRMEMRDDLGLRAMGLDFLENFFVHLQGPMETSPGFEYKEDSPGTFGRIFPFYISTFAGFIVLVTTSYIYVTDQNGFVYADDQVLNGDFLDDGDNWEIIDIGPASVSFAGGACFLSPGPPAGQNAGIYQGFTVILGDPNQLQIQIVDGAGPMIVRVGSAEGLDDIYPQTTHVGAQTITLPNLISSTTMMWIECLVEGSYPAKTLDKITCYNTSTIPQVIEFVSPWTTEDIIRKMQIKMAPGTLDLIMTSPIETQILSYDEDLRDWDFGPANFTNTPVEWTGENWPVALTFHEGRLYLGGTKKQPEDWWATRPGVGDGTDVWERFRDWELGENADHALRFTMNLRGRIRWMMSSKNLVVGTERAEHIITSVGGIIIPGDIQSTLQSTYGSIAMQAIGVGNDILFVTPDGRKIRTIGYQWTKEAWVSRDVTFPSEHITGGGNRLVQVHYAANPYSLIYAVTALGTGVGCAYEAQAQTGGFFRRTTQGPIISSCVLSYGGRDEVWALIDRDFEGPDLSLEKSHGAENIKLDSFITLTSAIGTTSWSAPHLGGFTCQALVNDAVEEEIIVEADGSFETQYEAVKVVIGLQIISRATTMSLGIGTRAEVTTRPSMKRWSKLYARIVGSWKPKINGKRPPTRHPATPMGTMEPARTETVKVSNLGWDRDGRIHIEQDLPVTTEVAGIFGEISQEQL